MTCIEMLEEARQLLITAHNAVRPTEDGFGHSCPHLLAAIRNIDNAIARLKGTIHDS